MNNRNPYIHRGTVQRIPNTTLPAKFIGFSSNSINGSKLMVPRFRDEAFERSSAFPRYFELICKVGITVGGEVQINLQELVNRWS